MSTECEVEGCDRPLHSRVHCSAHDARLRQWGDVLAHLPVRLYGRRRIEAMAAEAEAAAYAPTPAEGHGFLWLV